MSKWYDPVLDWDNPKQRSVLFADECNIELDKIYKLKQATYPTIWHERAKWKEGMKIWVSRRKWDGHATDVIDNAWGVPIFSERLRKAMVAEGVGVQDVEFFPVEVLLSTKKSCGVFHFVGIKYHLPALDRRRTFMLNEEDDIDTNTGEKKVTSFGRAALKRKVVAGHDIIRLLECFPAYFVSERFRRLYLEHEFTGISRFTELEVT